jgi:hypothetical protein
MLTWCVHARRFDLQAVGGGSSGAGKKGARAPDLLPTLRKGDRQGGGVRFRDGKVVTTKGEKVIIEKVGEDWDGGSR